MSYNPYLSSTPPRPFRIMIGAIMAIAGLIFGMTGAVHEFHKAHVLQSDPVEIDWQTLASEGFGDNPHIRLVDVDIVDPYIETDELFEDEDLDAMMDDPELRSHLQTQHDGHAKIIPAGVSEDSVEWKVQLAPGMKSLDEGFRQVDESQSISGMVSSYSVDQIISDFIRYCKGDPPREKPDDGEIVYTITPIEKTPDLSLSRWAFLTSGFALCIGLILCGSGGPGVWCCWYAPLPSLMSLIGYPMRYGRGTISTRLIYAGAGAAVMVYGMYLLMSQGRFGTADGNPIFHSLGFAALFIGLAGVLSVPSQITVRALDASVDSTPKRKKVRMSWEQACSLDPVVNEIDYEDQPLVATPSLPLSGDLKIKAKTLAAAGFSNPEPMQWQRELGLAAAAIQVGCQNMVVSDLEYNNQSDIIESALISVLESGLPIITISANSGIKRNRANDSCLLHRSSSSEPSEMLSEHLEMVIGEAERRNTVVIEFDESETREVVHLARRVIANLQGEIGGQIVNVGPKRYGRFHFPPAPVPEFTSASY